MNSWATLGIILTNTVKKGVGVAGVGGQEHVILHAVVHLHAANAMISLRRHPRRNLTFNIN